MPDSFGLVHHVGSRLLQSDQLDPEIDFCIVLRNLQLSWRATTLDRSGTITPKKKHPLKGKLQDGISDNWFRAISLDT